jgi:hypothetical protein
VTKTHAGQEGLPTVGYYLNRKQAIFITATCVTQTATEVTIEIIERIDAYARDDIRVPKPPADPLREILAREVTPAHELVPRTHEIRALPAFRNSH